MNADWKVVSLTEIYSISSGLSKPREEFGFGYPFVTFKDVLDNFFLPTNLGSLVNSTPKERENNSVRRGDVFLTRTSETQNELGMSSVALIDYENATFNGFTKRLRPINAQAVLPEYAGYFFRGPKFRQAVSAMSVLSTRASLNNEMIGRLSITLPPWSVQKDIASVLKCLDDKIELNRRMNATLEAMARALFQSWFVDFDPVRAKMDGRKPVGMDDATAALFPEKFEETQLGVVPKGWKITRISDCCERIHSGGTPRKDVQEYWSSPSIPWLTSGEVRQPMISKTENYISDKGLLKSAAKWVPASSTVVALYGATAGQVSFLAIDATTNQAVCSLVAKPNFEFFNFFLMRNATSVMENKAVGSAQQNISKGVIEETSVVIPETELLIRFDKIAKSCFSKWKTNLLECNTLAVLRDTLLPKLLSGELSIAGLEKELNRD